MSDAPQGPGWWQAADGKWYPPPTAPIPPPPGGPPPGSPTPPASGGSSRTGLFVALGVLAVIAVVAVVVTMGKDDDGRGTAGSASTTEPEEAEEEETAPPTTEAPEVNPVVVVEQGFLNYTTDEGPRAGYGFVLQNNGQEILRGIDTIVRFYGATGDEALWKANLTVDMLRPGEKIGYGDELSGELEGVAVERMEVEIPYIPQAVEDPSRIPDGGFQISNIKTEASSIFLETTFTIGTTYSTDVIFPVAYALYRNAAGEIVGGASATGLILPGGTMPPDAKIGAWSIIPGVVATEIYVDPGLLIQ